MQYKSKYTSPIGDILIAADDIGLVGVWFLNQKHFAVNLNIDCILKETPIIKETKKWLDIYFSGKEPNFNLPLNMKGTPFQIEVWKILQTIPYGKTITYGEIARQVATNKGINKMSAQAVGGAVGRNPISIIIPCHRVIGKSGAPVGYAAGINIKIKLLKLEKIIVKD